jgi:hypothetical protein
MRIRSLTMLALLYGGSAYADADMTGTRELQMMQCPSATPGAKTRLRKIRHGVELRVSADEEWQRRELRRRARHQAETTAQRTRGHEEHTGEGTARRSLSTRLATVCA